MQSRFTEGRVVGRGADTPRSPCLLSIWYNVCRYCIAVGHKVPSWPSFLSFNCIINSRTALDVVGKRWWWWWRWIRIHVISVFVVDCKRSKTILIAFWNTFTQRVFPLSLSFSLLLYCSCFCCCTCPNVNSHIHTYVCMHVHIYTWMCVRVCFGWA